MAFAKRKKPQSSEIPTDSVSDIAFLLIIFFILTTTIRKLTGFSTELPAADKMATQPSASDSTPTIVLTEETISFNGGGNEAKVTMDELRAKLKELKLAEKQATDPKKVILMEPSPGIQYQRYYEVMSSISSAGGVVGILMEEQGGGQAK